MGKQGLAHAQGLGALPCEQPSQLSRPARRQPHLETVLAGWAPGNQGLQLTHQLGLVCCKAHRPLPKWGSTQIERRCQVSQLQAGLGLHLLEQIGRQLRQSCSGAGRKGNQLQRHLGTKAQGRCLPGGIRQHHMGIGAAKSKRTHPHHGRALGIGEGLEIGLHLQLEC